MEALLHQHTYARSPLRAYTDGDTSDIDPLKAHLQHMKGKSPSVKLWAKILHIFSILFGGAPLMEGIFGPVAVLSPPKVFFSVL